VRAPACRPAPGFSIVEALIALVVLSIGMLGIAALYVESLQAGRSAIYRTQAVNLATDMADRIRANRLARAAYNLPAGAQPAAGQCAPTNTRASVNCTPQQLATDDLARWLATIRAQMPGGGEDGLPTGTVNVNELGATAAYSIQVIWSEPGARDELGRPRATYILNLQI
jgi:type IV pilus assembly protein PilV